MPGKVKKNQVADIPTKSGKNYSYAYTDLAQVHDYLESIGAKYYQQIKRIDGSDYIMTKRFLDGQWEDEWLQGCRVVDATLLGNENPAQKQGSAITYARRYSVMMAFGLATEDDAANSLNVFTENKIEPTEMDAKNYTFKGGKHSGKTIEQVMKEDAQYIKWWLENKADNYFKKCYEIVIGEKLPTEKEQDERIKEIASINNLILETDTDMEDIYNHFHVKSLNELNNQQMKQCVRILEQKLLQKVVNDDMKTENELK